MRGKIASLHRRSPLGSAPPKWHLAQVNWRGIASWMFWCRFDPEQSNKCTEKAKKRKKQASLKVSMIYRTRVFSFLTVKEFMHEMKIDILLYWSPHYILLYTRNRDELEWIWKCCNHYPPKHTHSRYNLRPICSIWVFFCLLSFCFNHASLKSNCWNKGILTSLADGYLVLIKLFKAGGETKVKSHVECQRMFPIQTLHHTAGISIHEMQQHLTK